MRWSKVFMAGGAAVGAAAIYNAFVRRGVGALPSTIEGDEEWFLWRGHRIAYTRRGEGAPLLLIHSIHPSASSYEWRHNAAALGAAGTVYTLDLLGFGRSDRPSVRYSARLLTKLIDDFVRLVIGEPTVLIGSGLAGAYAITLAAQDPESYPAVVAVCPTGLSTMADASRRMTPRHVMSVTPVVGTTMFNALVSRRSIRSYLERAYRDKSLVTNELVDWYYTTSHQPGAQHAPSALLAGLLNVDVGPAMRRLRQPMLLIWGEQSSEAPVEDARGFRTLKHDLELAIFDPAGDLPHDEHADGFNELVTDFVGRVGQEVGADGRALRARDEPSPSGP
jgi:pimeloyl-ACP methyl ester carboxylesterase